MKEMNRNKVFDQIKQEVKNINYTIKVNSSLNRNDLAKLKAQKQILFTLAEKLGYNESEVSEIVFGY